MKAFTLVILLFAAGLSQSVKGQTTSPWIEFSPSDESFRVSMPRRPEQESQTQSYGDLSVSGKKYTTTLEGTTFVVWSLVKLNAHPDFATDGDAYLDACADLVWESLLKPARDKLPRDGRIRAGMGYTKELPTRPLSGREYSITLGEQAGTTRFYVDAARIYVLLAMNTPGGPWESERFVQSFTLKPGPPMPATLDGNPGGYGPGVRIAQSVGATDYNRVFSARDMTERVRILDKPEPTYTESARKFGVQGTVVLRAVFSKEGQVTSIFVVRKLPHGLTQAGIAAAKRIRFTPATKDGHPVSQYMQLEYNFNLY
jgi:TonB family protein